MFAWKAGTLKCFQSPFLIVGGDAHAHITSRGVAKPQIAQCQVARDRRQEQPVSLLRGSPGMRSRGTELNCMTAVRTRLRALTPKPRMNRCRSPSLSFEFQP